MGDLKAKRLPDGRAMLNLACGTRMHLAWTNLDFSPYARLARRHGLARLLRKIGIISAERFRRLQGVDPDIICWDLRKGIPFPDETFDVVYHSHFLEHLDRSTAAPTILSECQRVLKPGGVLRIAVPDLELWVEEYRASITQLGSSSSPEELDRHEGVIGRLLDQMTRVENTGTSRQRPLVRRLERIIRGGASRVGELHRWMYDRYTLRGLLLSLGFREIRVESATTSRVVGWSGFLLDNNADGSGYKPESLYVESLK